VTISPPPRQPGRDTDAALVLQVERAQPEVDVVVDTSNGLLVTDADGRVIGTTGRDGAAERMENARRDREAKLAKLALYSFTVRVDSLWP
jgi:hypothetical protein